MGVILLIAICVILIFLGISISVWFYTHSAPTMSHIKRILRYRKIKPLSPAAEEISKKKLMRKSPCRRALVYGATRRLLHSRPGCSDLFAMPTYAIILSIVAGVLDVLGVIGLLIETFDGEANWDTFIIIRNGHERVL